MSTPSLTDFLLARIAEDEAVAERLRRPSAGDPWGWQEHPHPLTTCGHGQRVVHATPARVLAECEAKRRIVAALPADPGGVGEKYDYDGNAWAVLCALALPYADHDDYDASWRP